MCREQQRCTQAVRVTGQGHHTGTKLAVHDAKQCVKQEQTSTRQHGDGRHVQPKEPCAQKLQEREATQA